MNNKEKMNIIFESMRNVHYEKDENEEKKYPVSNVKIKVETALYNENTEEVIDVQSTDFEKLAFQSFYVAPIWHFKFISMTIPNGEAEKLQNILNVFQSNLNSYKKMQEKGTPQKFVPVISFKLTDNNEYKEKCMLEAVSPILWSVSDSNFMNGKTLDDTVTVFFHGDDVHFIELNKEKEEEGR